MTEFNLIDEPWLPVILKSGEVQEMGLREALLTAPETKGLTDPLPPVEFGLYRLLGAVAQDALDLSTEDALVDALEAGAFDAPTLDAYFAKWRDRFDLFSKKYPFLQTAGMDGEEEKPLAALLPPLPSGTNAMHFHRAHQDEFGVAPAVAARLLTSIAPFMTAGGAGLSPSINGAPSWYMLLRAESLFKILCLNCDAGIRENNTAPPSWRANGATKTGRQAGASLMESLTWQPRRIQLTPGATGVCAVSGREPSIVIRTMRFSAGASCEFSWRDPAIAYKTDDKGKVTPLRPQENREVWRDSAGLGLLHEGERGQEDQKIRLERPRLVDQYARLLRHGAMPKNTPLSLSVYGMRTDMKMKVFEWHRESLRLPGLLILNDRFHSVALKQMRIAEDVDRGLRSALKLAYPRGGAGNASALDTVIGYARRRYWRDLRQPYEDFLFEIAALDVNASDEAADASIARWKDHVRNIGWSIFDEAVSDFDNNGRALERQVYARTAFRKTLHFALDPVTPSENKKKQKTRQVTAARPAAVQGAPH